MTWQPNTLHDILRRCEEAGFTVIPIAPKPDRLAELREDNERQARRIAALSIALVFALFAIVIQGLVILSRAGLWAAIDGGAAR